MDRNKRSVRKRTHKATENNKSKSDVTDTLVHYLITMNALAAQYALSNILNVDETPLYIDMPMTHTIDSIGAKSVDIDTSGYDKHRITVTLTISASGVMHNAFLIFQKLVKAPKIDNMPDNVVLAASKTGFMDAKLMYDYCVRILKPITDANGKCLLILDGLSSHSTDG